MRGCGSRHCVKGSALLFNFPFSSSNFHFHYHFLVCVINSTPRLFLVSQQSELQLTSDLSTRTSIVNFSATLEGLQDQLLSVVVDLVRLSGVPSCIYVLTDMYRAPLSHNVVIN